MNHKAKAFLIPIAAFAVTVTGASAFNSQVLEEAGLTANQIAAFEEARERREEGDKEGARDVLVEAGIDKETVDKIRESMHEHRQTNRTAIDEAVSNNDYVAFQEAVASSPIADIVNTEEDFRQFAKAHELREEAQEIMEDLGFAVKDQGEDRGVPGRHMGMGHFGRYSEN